MVESWHQICSFLATNGHKVQTLPFCKHETSRGEEKSESGQGEEKVEAGGGREA